MKRGLFISLEGGEGCGKSTQAARLAARLQRAGHKVVLTREPGGSAIGERIRDLLKESRGVDTLCAEGELLLFAAARAQLVREVIWPALYRGNIVVCDRFADSTTAYQGFGRQLDMKLVRAINDMAVGNCWPHLTILLDVDVRVGLERADKRSSTKSPDRMGELDEKFYERVRAGFLKLAREEPRRFVVVKADTSEIKVAVAIWKIVQGEIE